MAEAGKSRFDRGVERARGAREIGTTIVGLLAAVLLLVVVARLLRQDVVLVDSISVGSSASKDVDLDSATLSNWLLDRMADVRRRARVEQGQHADVALTADEPDLQV